MDKDLGARIFLIVGRWMDRWKTDGHRDRRKVKTERREQERDQ